MDKTLQDNSDEKSVVGFQSYGHFLFVKMKFLKCGLTSLKILLAKKKLLIFSLNFNMLHL